MVPNKKAVVLLSGGVDSTTVLAIARKEGFETYAMSFRYGQRHKVEIEKARDIAAKMCVGKHVVIEIDLRAFGGSALTSDIEVPKDRPVAEISHRITGNLCAGPKHDFSELCARLGGSARSKRHFHRGKCARL